ncbi:MAG: hypothetical protein V9F06_13055 [Thermomicrobiales bacterium]
MQSTTSHPQRHVDIRHVRFAAVVTGILLASLILIAVRRNADTTEPILVAPAVTAPIAGMPSNTAMTFESIRFLEQNTYLPDGTAAPATDYSLDWKRFVGANSVIGARTDPIISMGRQRFIDANTYLPGYTDKQSSQTLSGDEIRMLEQNLYLPGDGNGYVNFETPPLATVDHSDLKAYFSDGLGQGWVPNGKPTIASDITASRGQRGAASRR